MTNVFTAPALVAHGPWSSETRQHALFRFMESLFKDFFDTREHKAEMADYTTDDFSVITPHGQHLSQGREHTFATGAAKFYVDPLTAYAHVPYNMIGIESKDAWDVYVQFHLFANVTGTPVPGETKVKDDEGRQWDIRVPEFYHFDLAKVPGAKIEGLKLRHLKWMKDTGGINEILRKRGGKEIAT